MTENKIERSHLNAHYPKDSNDAKLLEKRIEQLGVAIFQVKEASGKGHLGNVYGLFVIEILQAEIESVRARFEQVKGTPFSGGEWAALNG